MKKVVVIVLLVGIRYEVLQADTAAIDVSAISLRNGLMQNKLSDKTHIILDTM